MVKSYDGALVELPDSSWIDNIGSINPNECYVMSLNSDAAFEIEGKRIHPEEPLFLHSNWNWIGYYGEGDSDAETAFQGIVGNYDNHNLVSWEAKISKPAPITS